MTARPTPTDSKSDGRSPHEAAWQDPCPPDALPPTPWEARDSRVLDADGTELFLVHNVARWQHDRVAAWLVGVVNAALDSFSPDTAHPPQDEFHPCDREDCASFHALMSGWWTRLADLAPDRVPAPRPGSPAQIWGALRDAVALGGSSPDPATRWKEPEEGPNDGHTWRIKVTSRSSSSVVGDPEHHDAGRFDGPMRASVRAWSLKDAFQAAAELPLFVWIPMEDEEDEEDEDAAAVRSSADPADLTRREVLADIIAVVNKHQGGSPDRAMAEILEILMVAIEGAL